MILSEENSELMQKQLLWQLVWADCIIVYLGYQCFYDYKDVS
jgi:hypothetical protein